MTLYSVPVNETVIPTCCRLAKLIDKIEIFSSPQFGMCVK